MKQLLRQNPKPVHEFVITSLAWLAYFLIFYLRYHFLGIVAASVALIPIAVSSWFGGMAWALLAVCIAFSANMYMFMTVGHPPFADPIEHIPGNFILFVFAIAIGWANENRFRLAQEIAARRAAQEELQYLNANLEAEAQKRAQELVHAATQLEHEQLGRQIAEREARYHEAILEVVSYIGEISLKTISWTEDIEETLEKLGQAAGADRVYVYKNSTGPQGELVTSNLYEWAAEGVEAHIDDPNLRYLDFHKQGLGRWTNELSEGKTISGTLEGLPESESRFLSAQGLQSVLVAPIFAGQQWWGFLGFDSVRHPRVWSGAEIDALSAAASILGAAILREEDYERALLGWAKALELRDEETEGHTRRVTQLTVELAKKFDYSGQELVDIRRGALLHDIGKMGIPDSVLLKPGPLDEQEWALMRQHPIFARDMLAPIVFLNNATTIPYYHHERWNGSGYPDGLKGEAIPLPARIFAVVDVWDALRSDRPYRRAWKRAKVLSHLRENSNILFDQGIVGNFVEMLEEEEVANFS